MIANINNFGVVNFYENNNTNSNSKKQCVEDIKPIENTSSNTPDSILFTKKAHKEGKIPAIIQALQKSLIGRNDKTRALVQELQSWQKEDYIDPYFNAQVMYDELNKIISLPFGYDAFKRLYNNTRS